VAALARGGPQVVPRSAKPLSPEPDPCRANRGFARRDRPLCPFAPPGLEVELEDPAMPRLNVPAVCKRGVDVSETVAVARPRQMRYLAMTAKLKLSDDDRETEPRRSVTAGARDVAQETCCAGARRTCWVNEVRRIFSAVRDQAAALGQELSV
jgi:hypothetical protein